MKSKTAKKIKSELRDESVFGQLRNLLTIHKLHSLASKFEQQCLDGYHKKDEIEEGTNLRKKSIK